MVSLRLRSHAKFREAFMTWRLIGAIAIVDRRLISFVHRTRTIIILSEVTLS